jgi:hypothetical protein
MRIATLLLIASFAIAQTPPPARATFHLPAGDHSVSQLLSLAEQAVKKPIGRSQIDDLGEKAPLRLQVELALAGDDFEDVLGALLSTRGLVLARSEDGKGYEVLPTPRGDARWLGERALELSVAELHRRAAHCGPVRVVVPTTADVEVVRAMIGPHLAMAQRALHVEKAATGIAFTGLADVVRFGIAQVARVDAGFAKQLPPAATAPWPRPGRAVVHELPAGRYSSRELVDRLATALGRQHVLSNPLAAAPDERTAVEVTAAIRGDDVRFEDGITALLWRERLLLVPLSLPNLYELVRVQQDTHLPSERAAMVSAAELAARPTLVAWVSLEIDLAGRGSEFVLSAARDAFRAGKAEQLSVATTTDCALVTGISLAIGEILPALTAPK